MMSTRSTPKEDDRLETIFFQRMNLRKKQLRQTDASKNNKIALVSRTRELITEDLDKLLAKLYPRLDRTLSTNFVPRFNGRGVASGRIWFECTNSESRTCLEKHIKDITDTWNRGSLDIVEWFPTSPLERVCVSIPWMNDERTSAQLVVSRLDNLNPHLGNKRWHNPGKGRDCWKKMSTMYSMLSAS